ncbi:MAG: MraY family glycosyltransferase [bacterium]
MQLLVLGTAVALGWLLTGWARQIALQYGIVNAPNPIVPDHREPVAYLGGVGILAAAFGAMALYRLINGEGALLDPHFGASAPALLVGGLLFMLIGLWDDLREFPPKQKFGLQLAALVVVMSMGGLTREVSGNVFFDNFFAGLWILAMANAFNFIDVCDGLAGAVAVVTFGLFAVTLSSYPIMATALAGASLGFLYWNRPPAKIFMGDAGSNFLGFMIGAFSLTETSGTSWWPYIAMMTLFAGVPFFDLLFQSGVRIKDKRPWWVGGPDSFALRLQRAGFGKVAVDLIAIAVAIFFWTSAWLLPHLNIWGQVAIIVVVNIFNVLAWRYLRRYEVQPNA